MLNRRRFAAGMAGGLALAACGRRAPPQLAGESAPQVAAGARNFADLDPHDWTGQTPHRLPVHGIDVSRWQETINWTEARRNGVAFAFVKATEGGDGLNPSFMAQWQASRLAGVPRGAFHFYYFCTDPETQARWFIRTVPREPGSLPPVLDLEWNPYSPTCRLRPPADEVRRLAQRWIDIVAAHYGQRPIVYTGVDFYEDNDLVRLNHEEFWLRSVTAHPSDRYPGAGWTFWQYSGTGSVPGITGKVDLNAFAGSDGEWRRWLARRSQT